MAISDIPGMVSPTSSDSRAREWVRYSLFSRLRGHDWRARVPYLIICAAEVARGRTVAVRRAAKVHAAADAWATTRAGATPAELDAIRAAARGALGAATGEAVAWAETVVGVVG